MSDDMGFKQPPRTSQFRKGQSGNPRGRPKGTRNLSTDVTELPQPPGSVSGQPSPLTALL